MSSENAEVRRSERTNPPMSRFSSTVMPGKIPRPSGTWQMPLRTRRSARTFVRSSPSKVIRPDCRPSSPEMVFIVVVFPAPLAPISETICPSWTDSVIPRSAWMRP